MAWLRRPPEPSLSPDAESDRDAYVEWWTERIAAVPPCDPTPESYPVELARAMAERMWERHAPRHRAKDGRCCRHKLEALNV